MATIIDNDILITQSDGMLYLDLECGYGQPVVTTIYLKKLDGTTVFKKEFKGNARELEIDEIPLLQYSILEIHSTIDDVHDNPSEETDVSLKVSVYDMVAEPVGTEFTRKTIGKGIRIHSFYYVTIL